jgi:hypothetical protein
MYTNRKEGGGAGWQGDFVEELLGQSRKRERRLGKKRKQRQKNLPRTNTEKHGISISRDTEKAESAAED